MINDTKTATKEIYGQITDLAWQISGAKERTADVAALIAKHDDLLERYVQLRINLASTSGDTTID